MELEKLTDQVLADSHNWFPSHAANLTYLGLCLTGEAGEVANLIKKVDRGDFPLGSVLDKIGEELIDVLIYLLQIAGTLQVDIEEVYNDKRAVNLRRFGPNRSHQQVQ